MKPIEIHLIILCLSIILRSVTQGKTIFDRIDLRERLFADEIKDNGKDRDHATSSSSVSNLGGAKSSVRLTPLGLAFNDIDDVIHIIEPPRHFQEMKRRRRLQQQHGPVPSPPNVRARQAKPKANHAKHVAMTASQAQAQVKAKAKTTTTTKVKDRPMSAKVEKPEIFGRLHRNNRKKAAIKATNLEAATHHDLMMQGTRLRAENQLPQEAIFPLEILASVRKTERLKHNVHHQQQQGPLPRQRVKMQKTHTVIMERGHEKSRYAQGHENRAGGFELTQKSSHKVQRSRRDVARIASVDINSNIEHAQQAAALSLVQGSQLLARLDSLLKYASHYVPDDSETATHNGVLDELRTRFQHEFEPKQLIGEIEPTPPNAVAPEHELIEILESSLNATGMIMQELMQKQIGGNAFQESNKCIGIESSSNEVRSSDVGDGDALQQLQTKIDCMRQQLSAVREKSAVRETSTYKTTVPSTTTTTTPPPPPPPPKTTSARGKKRFTPQRTRAKTIHKFVATTLQPGNASTSSPFFKRARAQTERATTKFEQTVQPKNRQQSISPHKVRGHTDAVRNVSTAAGVLLYDDIMTNIRSMLELGNTPTTTATQESRSIDEEADTAIGFIDAASTTNSPSTSTPTPSTGANKDSNYFRDLNLYWNEVQRIVTHLPQAKTQSTGSGSSAGSSRANWYLINEDGKISETRQQPNTVIFHRFPDIPNASVYAKNQAALRTASLTSTKQHEETYV